MMENMVAAAQKASVGDLHYHGNSTGLIFHMSLAYS